MTEDIIAVVTALIAVMALVFTILEAMARV